MTGGRRGGRSKMNEPRLGKEDGQPGWNKGSRVF